MRWIFLLMLVVPGLAAAQTAEISLCKVNGQVSWPKEPLPGVYVCPHGAVESPHTVLLPRSSYQGTGHVSGDSIEFRNQTGMSPQFRYRRADGWVGPWFTIYRTGEEQGNIFRSLPGSGLNADTAFLHETDYMLIIQPNGRKDRFE